MLQSGTLSRLDVPNAVDQRYPTLPSKQSPDLEPLDTSTPVRKMYRLCIARGCKILFELFVQVSHHTSGFHAIDNFICDLLTFLLRLLLALDDFLRVKVPFVCEPLEDILV